MPATAPEPETLDLARRHTRYRVQENLTRINRRQRKTIVTPSRHYRGWDPEDEAIHLRGVPVTGILGGAIQGTRPDLL